ncbi:ZIP family metal transporter [Candidatus Gracilibacteria bacterium]|nr:ZIP family metal transporter [Candidatus Gracilibacteria bacterium]
MSTVWLYSLGSVLLVSLISLIGVFTLGFAEKSLRKFLLYMVSFSAGALFGDAFIHLLPEVVEATGGFELKISLMVLVGLAAGFLVEKVIHWRHCHHPTTAHHPHPVAKMNLVGDIVHNLIDGLIIGASYLVSIEVGIATTIAVIFHEIPQEIGDFGILLHGGYSRRKALLMNFLISLAAVFGVVMAILLGGAIEHLELYFVPFAAGMFIYIAGADLIPELHKEVRVSKSLLQFAWFSAGIFAMLALTLME